MKKLTIKRSEWLRGEGFTASKLLRPEDGKKCCLGVLSLQLLGATEDQIKGVDAPARVPEISWPEGFIRPMPHLDGAPSAVRYMHNSDCEHLMEINDNRAMSDVEREFLLVENFQKFGIDVEFVD
jgi:hypothetical protein